MSRAKVLFVGDAGVSTGFARNTHHLCNALVERHDVEVLAINYNGEHDWPYPWKYRLHPAWLGGEGFGTKRLPHKISELRPDVVVIQQDPWNFPAYFSELRAAVSSGALDIALTRIPFVGIVPVDGKNCRGTALKDLQHAVFWTKFGASEAAAGGYRGESSVVPLGVDLDVYRPVDRMEARRAAGLSGLDDAFVVGCVNRNQPRKRYDLLVEYFAEWVRTCEIPDAYLFVHVAPTGEQGYDVQQLMSYHLPPSQYGRRLIYSVPEIGRGVPEERLVRMAYGSFDVMLTTTQGEGWGLTTMEGMACGIPQIVPDWSALGEWTETAVLKVPCTSTAATTDRINVIGGIADKRAAIEALDLLYRNRRMREKLRGEGLQLVSRPCYRWPAIGAAFADVVDGLLARVREAELQEA